MTIQRKSENYYSRLVYATGMDRDCPEPTRTQRNLDLLRFTKALTLKSQILCVQTFLAGGEGVTTSGAHINGLCNHSNIMTTFKGLFLLYWSISRLLFQGFKIIQSLMAMMKS